MPGSVIAGATNMAPKKGFSMPPAVWVPAAAGLAGGLLQNRAQGQANRAQQQATNQSMALERERMAEERRRYDQQYELSMAQRRLRDQVARQILAQHGINIPDPAAAAAGKSAGYKGTEPSVSGAPAGGMQGFRNSLLALSPGASGAEVSGAPAGPVAGGMAPPPGPQAGPPAPGLPASSMAGLTNWSDELWRKQ